MTELRLFVWDDFAPDYTSGLAFAIAPTVQEAQRLIVESKGYDPLQWGQCTEYPINEPIAFACSGGG